MAAAKTTSKKVKIAAGHVVYVDGTPYVAGQVVTLPSADADQLVRDGDAEKA